jgi:hypothetical protein
MKTPGTLVAARYGFAPNRLDLCGPHEARAILEYLSEGASDRGLAEILTQFVGAYPYLSFIAASNGISDPFDRRVVEAYWIGNELLNNVRMADFYRHLEDRFRKRAPRKLFQAVLGQIPDGARPHHNFHVFAMPIRTGHVEVAHTVQTMDECRISWGTVKAVVGDELAIERQPLVLKGDDLVLGDPVPGMVRWRFNGKAFLEVQPGEVVAVHWGCACDRLTPAQLSHLKHQTRFHLLLVNRRHRLGVLV